MQPAVFSVWHHHRLTRLYRGKMTAQVMGLRRCCYKISLSWHTNLTLYPWNDWNFQVPQNFLYARRRRVVLCCALHPSVCPSVNFSCPFHNSDTVQDIFMKLGTNINHHQTMCRNKNRHSTYSFLRNYGLLKVFLWKSCPFYNLDIVQNIFMKLCTNLNPHQTMCRKKIRNSAYTFTELCPFEMFPMKIVSAL